MTRWDVLKSDTMQQAYGVEEYRVRRMIKLGKLSAEDCIRRSGTQEWIRVGDINASMWQDDLPTKDEQRALHKSRKQDSDRAIEEKSEKKEGPSSGAGKSRPAASQGAEPRSTRKDRPNAPIAGPPPAGERELPPPSSTPDPKAETIHVDSSLVAGRHIEGLSEHQAFEVGPKTAEEPEAPHRPRLVPPPVRRTRREDKEDLPLVLREPRVTEGLDLTSMVDVVFLLLLFFMVASTMSGTKSLEVPPPPPEDQAAQQAPTVDDLRNDNILIDVLDDNTVLLDDRKAPLAELVDLLRREVRQTGMNEVVVRASGDAFHETVVAVFDAANEVGVQRIRLANPTSAVEPPG